MTTPATSVIIAHRALAAQRRPVGRAMPLGGNINRQIAIRIAIPLLALGVGAAVAFSQPRNQTTSSFAVWGAITAVYIVITVFSLTRMLRLRQRLREQAAAAPQFSDVAQPAEPTFSHTHPATPVPVPMAVPVALAVGAAPQPYPAMPPPPYGYNMNTPVPALPYEGDPVDGAAATATTGAAANPVMMPPTPVQGYGAGYPYAATYPGGGGGSGSVFDVCQRLEVARTAEELMAAMRAYTGGPAPADFPRLADTASRVRQAHAAAWTGEVAHEYGLLVQRVRGVGVTPGGL